MTTAIGSQWLPLAVIAIGNRADVLPVRAGRQGVGRLLDAARSLARRRGCDIYVVGAANVGKSSLLNRLTNAHGDSASKQIKAKKDKRAARPAKRGSASRGPLALASQPYLPSCPPAYRCY